MACSISSQQAVSRLMRCTFKQCKPRHGFHPVYLAPRYTRQLWTRTQLNSSKSTEKSSEDKINPFESDGNHNTPVSTLQAPNNANPTYSTPNVSWQSQPTTDESKSSITPDQTPNSLSKPRERRLAPSKRRIQRLKGSRAIAAASTPPPAPTPPEPPAKEDWQIQKAALEKKFPEQPWNPAKKLSPDALEGIRAMHAQYPGHFTTPVLADHFKVSPEAIRRILKSKWKPNVEEEEERRKRWERRGERIWSELVEEKGLHPPKKWREKGIGRGVPRAPSGQLDVSRPRSPAARYKPFQ